MPNSHRIEPRIGKVHFPLSAKILLWFFLNLAFLGAAAWIFARVQLRFGLDSLLAGPVNDRLQSLAEVVTRQLETQPRDQWPEMLKASAASYHVQLGLYRNDGQPVASDMATLPPEVTKHIADARPRDGRNRPDGPRDRDRGPRDGDGGPRDRPDDRRDGDFRNDRRPPEERGPDRPPPLDDDLQRGPPGRREGPPPPPIAGGFPKSILHTANPTNYWVFIRMPLSDRSVRPPMPLTLVLSTPSLRGGGLLFDFTPWLIGGGVVFALSVLMWLPLVHGITRALRQMTSTAEGIAHGRFDAEVDARRSDELGRLGTALNHMSARLREFFTGQKRFLGDIAHELCSPLARMEMALGILEHRADDKQRSYVADVREELRHMSVLVQELLSFSKAGVGGNSVALKPVNLLELAGRVVAREAKDRGGIVIDLPVALQVMAEPDLLARALGNVVRNSIRYASPVHAGHDSYSYRPAVDADGHPSGPITISARESGAEVVLTVTDCGPGVPEEALHRLFDPFFRPESARTRETGGAGLGLAIVKSCVEACGGVVAVRNVQPNGLQVDFTLRRG